MSSITTRRLRLAADLFSFAGPSDKRSGTTPQLWLSNDYSIELACFYGAPSITTMVDSLANITSMTLALKALENGGAPAASATPLLSATVSSFNDACTYADWAADTDEQVVFTLSADEMTQTAGDVWLVVSAATAAGKVVTVLAGKVTLKEDGYNSAGTAPVVDGSAWTKAEADARYPRAALTALMGGAAGALDGEATTGLALDTTLRGVVVSGVLSWWQLQIGTEGDTEDAAGGLIKPDDFDADTNAKIWVQVA